MEEIDIFILLQNGLYFENYAKLCFTVAVFSFIKLVGIEEIPWM